MHVHHPPLPLVLAAVAVFAYTAVVWWLCHPFVKAFTRTTHGKRPGPRQLSS